MCAFENNSSQQTRIHGFHYYQAYQIFNLFDFGANNDCFLLFMGSCRYGGWRQSLRRPSTAICRGNDGQWKVLYNICIPTVLFSVSRQGTFLRWTYKITSRNIRKCMGTFKNMIFTYLDFMFCQFWKRRAPKSPEVSFNEIFKILNMGPISIWKHERILTNMVPISISKH